MALIEDIEKAIAEGEMAVAEAEKGIRILKATDEDTSKLEADLKLSKTRLSNLKAAVLKEKPKTE